MRQKILAVTPRLGLHARPASMFVSVSQRFLSEIKVSKEMDGEETVVNGKSIMGLMMLAAAFGEKVKVVVSGPDEGEAMAHIEALFSKKFDED